MIKLVLRCCSCVSRPSDNFRSDHSPIDTSWAKAREMRNKGSPTASNATILSSGSSRRTPAYFASAEPFNKKSEKTYSAATLAIAMADGDKKPVLSDWWGNNRFFFYYKKLFKYDFRNLQNCEIKIKSNFKIRHAVVWHSSFTTWTDNEHAWVPLHWPRLRGVGRGSEGEDARPPSRLRTARGRAKP